MQINSNSDCSAILGRITLGFVMFNPHHNDYSHMSVRLNKAIETKLCSVHAIINIISLMEIFSRDLFKDTLLRVKKEREEKKALYPASETPTHNL